MVLRKYMHPHSVFFLAARYSISAGENLADVLKEAALNIIN
jgi:hypothetical protein